MTFTNLQQPAWCGTAAVERWKRTVLLMLTILYCVEMYSYPKEFEFVSSFRMIDESYSLKIIKGGSKVTQRKKEMSFFKARNGKSVLGMTKSSTIGGNVEATKKSNKQVSPSSSLSIDATRKGKAVNSSGSFLLAPDMTVAISSEGMNDTSPSTSFYNIMLRLMSKFRARITTLSFMISVVPKVDLAIFATYAFSIVVNTIPTICLPLMAADAAVAANTVVTDTPAAVLSSSGAFSANVASICTMGGAMGKFINGFICQKFGGRYCATAYLVIISTLSMLLSRTSNFHGPIIAGMEFTQSIMWTACTLLLFNQYKNQPPKKFATAITTLSLTSSSFVLLTKLLGMRILKYFHWSALAQVGSFLALSGATVMFLFGDDRQINEQKNEGKNYKRNNATSNSPANNDDKNSFKSSLKNVLGSKLFWLVGLSHGSINLARGMDKVLGSFYQDAAQLPAHISSGMTSTVTAGFVYGLISGRKIQNLPSIQKKEEFLNSRYKKAIISALILVGCANQSVSSILGGFTTAIIVAIASGALSSNVSYQFFQIPAMVSKKFGKDKAVCISLIDGVAFFMAAPIWNLTSKIISSPIFGTHGWSMTWGLFAVMLFTSGKVVSNIMPSIVSEDKH